MDQYWKWRNRKEASETLQKFWDKTVIVIAVAYAFIAVSNQLLEDRELTLVAVRKNGRLLEYCNEVFESDTEVVLAAVQQSGLALKFASEKLRNTLEIDIAAVQQNGLSLALVGPAFRDHKIVVLQAIKQNPTAKGFITAEWLYNDYQICDILKDAPIPVLTRFQIAERAERKLMSESGIDCEMDGDETSVRRTPRLEYHLRRVLIQLVGSVELAQQISYYL